MGKKLYKILSTISITGIFVAVAILVCAITSLIKLNYILGAILAIIVVLCATCIISLPWVKQLEEKNNKIISIILLIFALICCIMWIVFVLLVVKSAIKDLELRTFDFKWLRISLILTTQLLVASTVTNMVLRFKKSMMAFQIVTYISNFLVDLYFTILFATITIKDNGISLKTIPDFMGSKIVITFLIIAFIYVIISSSIMKSIDKKKVRGMIEDSEDNKNKTDKETTEDINDKLLKLKNLLDNGLINQEDYETKKQEILKDM